MSDQTGVRVPSLPSWLNNGEVLFKVSNGRIVETRVICLDEKKVWTATDAGNLLSESMAQVDGAPIENREQVEHGAYIENFKMEYESVAWEVLGCIDRNWTKLKKHKSVLHCKHKFVRKANKYVRLTACAKCALKFRSFRCQRDMSMKMVSPEEEF